MTERVSGPAQPTRARVIFATVFVFLTVVVIWKVIDYRTQPPPPPASPARVAP